MGYTTESWLHLADCLKASRNGRSVASIALAAGLSHATIEAYEAGREYRRPPDKMWRLVNYYRWTPDSLRRVLAGGYPTILPPIPPVDDKRLSEIRELIVEHPTLSKTDKRRMLEDWERLHREGGVAV